MAWAIGGVIEGFYGRPWTWNERVAVARWCADRGMTHYVYAPKDDPLHRSRWREPYPSEDLDGFRRLAAVGGLDVGFGISPGLSVDERSAADREALWAKVGSVLEAGARLVVLALDDIPNRPGLGTDHAALTAWLHGRLAGDADLVLVPTEYVGTHASPYLQALADGVPAEVPIAWTGASVVNDTIAASEAAARAAAVGGRRPLLWDNYPVNDAVMADRLFLGALRGRDPALSEVCTGYLANAGVQPLASTLPLASIAAWLRGQDPDEAWEAEVGALGWRTLAEACDGSVPLRLVGELAALDDGPGWADAAAPLERWLEAAAACAAPGLEEEAGPWVEQVRAEASVGLAALRLHAASRGSPAGPVDADAVLLATFGVMLAWPAVRRARVSVLGPRCSFRPAIGQRPDGSWVLLPDALQEDANALDALVRLALAAASSARR